MKTYKKPGVKIQMTEKQWSEIYYAVTIKATRVRRGDYGPAAAELNLTKWADELEEIGNKIRSVMNI